MKKKLFGIILIGLIALMMGSSTASAIEYQLDRFYYETQGSGYDYKFDGSDYNLPYFIMYPQYFNSMDPTMGAREFRNLTHPEGNSTTSNDDVVGGTLIFNEADSYLDGDEKIIDIAATRQMWQGEDGAVAAYFRGTQEDLASNQFVSTLLYGSGTFAELGFGYDAEHNEYRFFYVNSDMDDGDYYMPVLDSTITSWNDETLAMRIDVELDVNGTATLTAYYYFDTETSPDPTVTTGWTPLDLTASNYNVIMDWGSDIHTPGLMGGFGQAVPEPSTIILILLGLGALYWKKRRKTLV